MNLHAEDGLSGNMNAVYLIIGGFLLLINIAGTYLVVLIRQRLQSLRGIFDINSILRKLYHNENVDNDTILKPLYLSLCSAYRQVIIAETLLSIFGVFGLGGLFQSGRMMWWAFTQTAQNIDLMSDFGNMFFVAINLIAFAITLISYFSLNYYDNRNRAVDTLIMAKSNGA